MAKKMTKKEMFAKLKELPSVRADEAMVAFIDHEIELLERKNSNGEKKPTKTQKENEVLKGQILALMKDGTAYSVSEIAKMVGGLSTQKITPLMTQMKKDILVVRSEVKGKSFYTKA